MGIQEIITACKGNEALRDDIRELADQLYEGNITDKGRKTLMSLAGAMGVKLSTDGETGVDGVLELTDQMLDAVAGGCSGCKPQPIGDDQIHDK